MEMSSQFKVISFGKNWYYYSLGGWKANLWNNYPQHKLEYVRIPPTFDEEFTTKHFDPVKLARYRDLKDKINELYKDKEAHDS